jgi:hypothetical protein
MKEYLVVRFCNKQDGTAVAPVTACDTEAEAWKAFYRLCGQAVDSEHLMDSVAILTKQGFELDYKCFEHAPIEPEIPEEPIEEPSEVEGE